MNQKKNFTKTEKIPKNNQRSFQAEFRAVSEDENSRKIELSFSSEKPYERWFGTEILDHSKGAIDLSRLNDIGVVLFNHTRDKVIGKILKAWNDGEKCRAQIEFDPDEDSEKIFQKVKNGTLKATSVGYTVGNYEFVKKGEKSTDGRFKGECFVATKWTPYEISIVSVPADETVGVGRDFDGFEMQDFNINTENKRSVVDATIQINLNSLKNQNRR